MVFATELKESTIQLGVFLINLIISTIFILFISSELQAKNILVIGDSHSCGAFGLTLVKKLSAQNDNVEIFCVVSSSPLNWIKGTTPNGQICKFWVTGGNPGACRSDGKVPPLDWILSQKHYDAALIALGTNSLGSPSVDPSYRTMVDKIKAKVSSCLWIGPPHLRPDQAKGFSSQRIEQMEKNLTAFYGSLKSSVEPSCPVIDSLACSEKKAACGETGDGVHRTPAAGVAWAENVNEKIWPTVKAKRIVPAAEAAR